MAADLFSEEEKKRMVEAIQRAEKYTSGEVKVHIEARCPTPDVLDRAREIFAKLNLNQTKLRNGVLFYVALEDHKFAVWGDEGIDAAVHQEFWDSTKDVLREYFRRGEIVPGLCKGVEMAGEKLKTFFPYESGDRNELSDDISFGE